jgi:flagellar basal body-associated protein FliL
MPLSSPKPSKSILILIVVAMLGALAGSLATYFVTNAQKTTNSGQHSAANKIQTGSTTPNGTVSPFNIAANPHNYLDKQVKAYGAIVPSSANQYSIVDQDSTNSLGMKLDFSKTNTDVKPFLLANDSTAESQKLVTVTGTVTKQSLGGNMFNYVLTVESIQ